MEEVFLFESKYEDMDGEHTVLVSETLSDPVVYNCIVDINTNIELEYCNKLWVEKDNGSTPFANDIGILIEEYLKAK